MKLFINIATIFSMIFINGCAGDFAKAFPQDPLLDAASRGNTSEIIRLVRDEGRDINYRDRNGETAMHHAARWCKARSIATLGSLGGNIDATSSNGDAAIHVAATKGGCGDTIRELIDQGVDVNGAGSRGESPLHKAAKHSELNNVELFIQRGANRSLEDGRGRTALDAAKDRLTFLEASLVRKRKEYEDCLNEAKDDVTCEDHSAYAERDIKEQRKIIIRLLE